jgi:hypothetical protein
VAITKRLKRSLLTQRLNSRKQRGELAHRDSILDFMGRTFSMIDSNLSQINNIEGNLSSEFSKGKQRNNDEIKSGASSIQEIMAKN